MLISILTSWDSHFVMFHLNYCFIIPEKLKKGEDN